MASTQTLAEFQTWLAQQGYGASSYGGAEGYPGFDELLGLANPQDSVWPEPYTGEPMPLGYNDFATTISPGQFASGLVGLGASALQNALQSNQAAGNAQEVAVQNLNTYEAFLKKVRDDYLAGPASVSAQNTALSTIDQGLAWMVSTAGLGNPALGDWGVNGIKDRTAGGKYSWIVGFRDPVANDPRLGNIITSSIEEIQGALGVSATGLAVIAAIIIALLIWRYSK